jgi:hypothetical protein
MKTMIARLFLLSQQRTRQMHLEDTFAVSSSKILENPLLRKRCVLTVAITVEKAM